MLPLLAFPICLSARAGVCTEGDGVPQDAYEWIRNHQLIIQPTDGSGAFLAVNLEKDYQAYISARGFTIEGPIAEPRWNASMEVLGLQREDGSKVLWRPGVSERGDLDLLWKGAGFDVQYVQSPDGLRQNFIVRQPPTGSGDLRVALRYGGGLQARSDGPNGLLFYDEGGIPRFAYNGLNAWDACGRILPARLVGDEVCDGTIAIVVDDAGATYPITIDPVSSTQNRLLTGSINSGQFGFAVSTAGDLNGDGYSDIAIGAPQAANGQAQEGVVYVFYGSNTGIGAVPDVILESNQAIAQFGYSLSTAGDVNGDGYSDLIVGAPTWESDAVNQSQEGSAWIFHGSASGIGTVPNIILQSNAALIYMGSSVDGIGDVNNDGYSDVIAGAWIASLPTFQEGAAYVYLGSAAGLTNTFANRLERNQGGAQFGSTVAGAGDLNGDGYSDVAVGAYRYDIVAGADDGAVFIYNGGPSGLGAGVNPAPIKTLVATGISAAFGWCASSAGDVNGDGYSDLIVGDWRDNIGGPSLEGTAHIFHGSATGLASLPATTLQSNNLNGWFGRSVSTAGDVNGDGYADVIVGAVTYSNGQAAEGAGFLYLGSSTGVSSSAFLQYELNSAGANMGESVSGAGDVNGDGYSDFLIGAKLYGVNGGATIYHGGPYGVATAPSMTRYSGSNGAHLGWSVSNAGDVNGDGYSDVVSGAPDASNGQAGEGLVYVHYGGTAGLSAVPNVTLEMNIAGARFGASVSSAGDVNGDGYADVVVGAPNSGNGRAYIFMGSPAGLGTVPALVLNGTAGSEFGSAVCTAGDINSDGSADVVVGAPGANRAEVHTGSPGGLMASVHALLTGAAGSRFGAAVGTAGDVNGDGFSDVIVGAPLFTNGQANEGAAFVYHGSPVGMVTVAATQLEPNLAGAHFGVSVAGAGDVNGNGYFDVIVGADQWASGQATEGGAFVYYGSAGGVLAAGFTTIQPNVVGAQLGYCVREAGDTNGDGYADVVIGAPYLTNGQLEEGRVYVLPGSPAGLGAATTLELNTAGVRMGWGIAGGGDVDGDGYSDVITGGPYASPTLTEEGSMYLFRGNQARSLDRRTRQLDCDLVTPMSTNSIDFSTPNFFGVGHRARSPIQRTRGRLRWEVVFEGQAFTGAPITNSVNSTSMSAGWSDLGVAGFEIKELINKLPGHIRYKWRVRVEYALNKLIDGQRFSRWFYGYASGLGDIGVLPVELLTFDGKAMSEGNLISWTTGSETGSDRFIVERSTDAPYFVPIGALPAAGHSARALDYALMDEQASQGLSYYRLRVVDTDGSEELSQVISVMRDKSALVVYPNPVEDLINWSFAQEGAARVRVFDALGNLVIDADAKNGTVHGPIVQRLPQGQYTLVLLDENDLMLARSRFVKLQAPIVR
ncbi:MAG: FG-GAP-like repeat-containing protein [Flavobacteriales bacterium]